MPPILFDTHTHVNFTAFSKDGEIVTRRALEAGIWMNVVGSQYSTSKRAVEYAEQYPEGVYASVGLHPIHLVATHVDPEEIDSNVGGFTSRKEEWDYEAYKKLAQSPKVVAIGEMGLEHFRLEEMAQAEKGGTDPPIDLIKERQEFVFREGLRLAAEAIKPIAIHCREANEEIIRILREAAPPRRGIMHCFSGTYEQAKIYIDMGFLISFAGVITFPPKKSNPQAHEELLKTAREMPLDMMLVETDAPYLTPVPHRGKRNEPSYVRHTAEFIAQLRGVPFETIAEVTTQNARRLFGIADS